MDLITGGETDVIVLSDDELNMGKESVDETLQKISEV